jgi:hypothetical protein
VVLLSSPSRDCFVLEGQDGVLGVGRMEELSKNAKLWQFLIGIPLCPMLTLPLGAEALRREGSHVVVPPLSSCSHPLAQI